MAYRYITLAHDTDNIAHEARISDNNRLEVRSASGSWVSWGSISDLGEQWLIQY